MPATVLKNKVMYRQFVDIVAFVNEKCCTCLRLLELYFPDTPHISAIFANIYRVLYKNTHKIQQFPKFGQLVNVLCQ